MWDVVLDWVSTRLDDDAAVLFVAQLERARELRAEGRLSDAHTMTSWALQRHAPRCTAATADESTISRSA